MVLSRGQADYLGRCPRKRCPPARNDAGCGEETEHRGQLRRRKHAVPVYDHRRRTLYPFRASETRQFLRCCAIGNLIIHGTKDDSLESTQSKSGHGPLTPATTDHQSQSPIIRHPGPALPATAKPHRDLVRAVLSARFADLVGVGALPTRPDLIGVQTGDVRHSGNQRAVAINIDVVRGSPIPREIHRLPPLHLVAARTERDLPRCQGRTCRRGGCSRCCRCWCRGWCSCWRRGCP
jgi:hypothetical protein